MTCSSRVTPLLAAVFLVSCSRESESPRPQATDEALPAVVIESSRPDAAPGERIAIRVGARSPEDQPLLGLSGTVQFDVSRLRYVGQPLTGQTLVLVNAGDARSGRLRIVAYNPAGLEPAPAELVFEVLGSGYLHDLDFRLEAAGTRSLVPYRRALPPRGIDPLAVPQAAGPAALLTATDWARQLTWGRNPVRLRPARSPGEGLIYGDVTLDGAVDLFDILFVANLTVGLQPLLTDPGKDYVIAGDVAPFNLPGLGEADDPVPPGLNLDGSHTIDLFDLLPIGNEVAGVDQPIVGEHIPGRTIAAARAIVSGTLDSNRTFFRDTVYELQGTINVPGGVKLTIQAGTRIEGQTATRGALVIRRGGRIDARGTRLEPIVFTCTSAMKTRGCWGGVVLNGFSLLNNGNTVAPTVGAHAADVLGCPERVSIGNPGLYGGCLVQDTSGVLRYVRIEYAGMAPAGSGPAPGLALLGAGSGTAIDSVQVRESLGDGLFLSGGTVNLRAVR
ncbi:MAG TPA: hypothetical protein VMJ30_04460, partial [Gemmatimonadales bacterium]|nr:hypothetical protein [Gemmatimonadales bacterium]